MTSGTLMVISIEIMWDIFVEKQGRSPFVNSEYGSTWTFDNSCGSKILDFFFTITGCVKILDFSLRRQILPIRRY